MAEIRIKCHYSGSRSLYFPIVVFHFIFSAKKDDSLLKVLIDKLTKTDQ